MRKLKMALQHGRKPSRMNQHMAEKQATAADIQEILDLMDWSIRDLADYWRCTPAAIYQWIEKGFVTSGIATWAVRKTLEEARAEHPKHRGNSRKAVSV
jgi:hypothetical protein